jgi:hypothetical protein
MGISMRKFALLVTVALVTTIAATSSATAGNAQTAGAKCGGGLTASLTPSVKGSYNFTLVCIQHDKCYAKFGISRGSCDTAFIGNMLAECKHAYPTENNAQKKRNGAKRHSCEHVAGLYHIAVVRNGEAAYEKAQNDAVTELFNGEYDGTGSVTATGTFFSADGTPIPVDPVTEQIPSVTVTDGTVDGVALVITPDPPLSAKATASSSPPIQGFSGGPTFDYTFSYSLNGPATVQVTISGSGDDGQGDTISWTGSFSGTNSSAG